jgi:hypothetical protein
MHQHIKVLKSSYIGMKKGYVSKWISGKNENSEDKNANYPIQNSPAVQQPTDRCFYCYFLTFLTLSYNAKYLFVLLPGINATRNGIAQTKKMLKIIYIHMYLLR